MRPPSPAQVKKAQLLAEAADVHTPAARLAQLAQGPKPEAARAVAANPSTPVEALRALLDRCPEEVLANPAWPLVAMSDPALAERAAPYEAIHTTDPGRLRELARDAKLYRVVAANPAADAALLEHLGVAGNEIVQELVARHPRCPADTLRRLAGSRKLVVARLDIVQAAAGHESTPPDVLAELAHHPHNGVREQVAGNRATPADTLRRLAGDQATVQRRLAANPSAPLDLLEALADSPDAHLLEVVATSPLTPGAVLERLLDSQSHSVRRAALVNPSLPREALARMTVGKGPDAVLARTTLRDREPDAPGTRTSGSRAPRKASQRRAPRKTP